MTIGKTSYVARIGSSTLAEALEFCRAESMALYTPSFERIHTMIYEKLSAYGITNFWTNAKHNSNQNKMEWM